MFCKICKKYPKLATSTQGQVPLFVSGTDKFRIEAIRSHETSVPHRSCVTQQRHDQEIPQPPSVPAKETPIGKAIMNIIDQEMEKLRFLFNTAYTLAAHNKPFSDMEMMCDLMAKNGVKLGENYSNRNRAKEFVNAIS